MLGITVAASTKTTTKIAMCLYTHKMVLPDTMAKYKLSAAHSTSSIVTIIRIIKVACKPSQGKVEAVPIDFKA